MGVGHYWDKLNSLKVGRYAEYLIKMELTAQGCDVYTSEVDDRGIDFVIRKDYWHYYDIQVKSFRILQNQLCLYNQTEVPLSR